MTDQERRDVVDLVECLDGHVALHERRCSANPHTTEWCGVIPLLVRSLAFLRPLPAAECTAPALLTGVKAALTDPSLSDGAKVAAAMTYLGSVVPPTADDIAWAQDELRAAAPAVGEANRCPVTKDAARCTGVRFHADSMNATPHTFEDASALAFVEKVRRLAFWEIADNKQALQVRLACIGAAAADRLEGDATATSSEAITFAYMKAIMAESSEVRVRVFDAVRAVLDELSVKRGEAQS